MPQDDCIICRKQRGLESTPPGGYIYQDDSWMVCHAPVQKGPLGTLFIESRRHILDFGDFNALEARTFGPLARRIYLVLRPLVDAHRIYQVSMMEGMPHFHAWLVPRKPDIEERGVAFLSRDLTCTVEAAEGIADALRAALQQA